MNLIEKLKSGELFIDVEIEKEEACKVIRKVFPEDRANNEIELILNRSFLPFSFIGAMTEVEGNWIQYYEYERIEHKGKILPAYEFLKEL